MKPTPKAAPEPAKPRVVKPAEPPARAVAPAPSAELRSKCSDILQKATLETLSASEQAFLRKECR
jgi:hypothetical protein